MQKFKHFQLCISSWPFKSYWILNCTELSAQNSAAKPLPSKSLLTRAYIACGRIFFKNRAWNSEYFLFMCICRAALPATHIKVSVKSEKQQLRAYCATSSCKPQTFWVPADSSASAPTHHFPWECPTEGSEDALVPHPSAHQRGLSPRETQVLLFRLASIPDAETWL